MMSVDHLYTIGFTKKNAREFFSILRSAHIRTLIDIRLNNNSQLAGFTKRDDLEFFLKEILSCDYKHMPILAPTEKILNAYKKKQISWVQYEQEFQDLMVIRQNSIKFGSGDLNHACLLCSEPTPEKCHRRLVAEYLRDKVGNIEIHHL